MGPNLKHCTRYTTILDCLTSIIAPNTLPHLTALPQSLHSVHHYTRLFYINHCTRYTIIFDCTTSIIAPDTPSYLTALHQSLNPIHNHTRLAFWTAAPKG